MREQCPGACDELGGATVESVLCPEVVLFSIKRKSNQR